MELADTFGDIKQGETYSAASTMIDDWYAVEAIDPQTFDINEPKSSQYNTSYLIVGDGREVIFDVEAANGLLALDPCGRLQNTTLARSRSR